jgi:hypothetical protein
VRGVMGLDEVEQVALSSRECLSHGLPLRAGVLCNGEHRHSIRTKTEAQEYPKERLACDGLRTPKNTSRHLQSSAPQPHLHLDGVDGIVQWR